MANPTLHPVLLAAALIALAPAHATSLEEARDSLTHRSPFVKWEAPQPQVTAYEPPVVNTGSLSREIEFKGILRIGEDTYFNVFDKVEGKSLMLAQDDVEAKTRFKVVGYDDGSRSITVQAGSGQKERIEMATSDGVSIPTIQAQPNRPPIPQVNGNNRPAITTQSTLPASERRRRVIPRRVSGANVVTSAEAE